MPLVEGLRARLRAYRRRRLAATGSLGVNRARVGLLATLVALFLAVGGSVLYLSPDPTGEQISLDELSSPTTARKVATATFLDEDALVAGELRGGESFWTAYPRSDAATADLIDVLAEAGARITVDPQGVKGFVRLLLSVLLPLMILANLFALFLLWGRGGSSGIGGIVSFGQVGDRDVPGGQRATGFQDVAGIEEAVVELKEVVDYLSDPARYDELGAAPPKGVLLVGPPGVGKTLLAQAVAGEAGVPFFSVAGAEFVESLVGVGAARVRDLFRRVRAVAPAIVFIDELDAAGRIRGDAGAAGGSEERAQTLNQLLVEIDGFDVSSGIVVMAATNRPDILDPALLRPGRFDRHITIDRPDVVAREQILRLHAAKRRRVTPGVDYAALARRTPGFSGADLANVVNEAALLTIREGRSEIGAGDFAEAIQRVESGPKLRGHLMSEDERRRIAVHEAGHAIVAAALGRAEDLHRVSIVARGRGAGATAVAADEDAVVLSVGQLRAQLAIALAGIAAEELVLEEASTAGDDDIERATVLAREMVGRYGMSELGKIRLLAPDAERFLGGPERVGVLSGELHAAFDTEVGNVVAAAADHATDLLRINHDDLDALVAALIEHETLEAGTLRAHLPEASTNGEPRRKRARSGSRAATRS